MGAGAVIQMTGRSKLSELGCIYRYMPVTFVLYMIGGFSISAFPLFSGFVSKSMEVSAAADLHLTWIWLLLTLASAGTFLHTGLKLPYFTFLGDDCGARPTEPPRNMLVAMGIAAFLCIFIGVYPDWLYNMLPEWPNTMPIRNPRRLGSADPDVCGMGFFLMLKPWGSPKISLDRLVLPQGRRPFHAVRVPRG